MKFETKRRIVTVALVVLTLWPTAHYGIVAATGLNPWKWFGWAMYCVPARRVRTDVADLATQASITLDSLDPRARARLLKAYDEFSDARMEFGELIVPDDFARAVLRAFPATQGIRIRVQHVVVDLDTAMVVAGEEFDFEYQRSELGL